jgi:hypothetical protein
LAAEQLIVAKSTPNVGGQIMEQKMKQQEIAGKCLRAIFTSSLFLARQGLAFSGHETEEGNCKQLLQV